MKELIDNLRRRGVVRSVTYYLGISWVVIGACDILFPMFGINEAVLKVVVWLVVGGLPVAFILAWLFNGDDVELSGEGGVRSGTDLLVVVLLAVVLALSAAYVYFGDVTTNAPAPRPDRVQVFVAPTDDLSVSIDPVFAQALDVEILDRLNEIPAWDTKALTSADDVPATGYHVSPSIRIDKESVRLNVNVLERPSGRLIDSFSGRDILLDETETQQRLAGITAFVTFEAISFLLQKQVAFERTGSFEAAELMEASYKSSKSYRYDVSTCMKALELDPEFEPALGCMAINTMMSPDLTHHIYGAQLIAKLRELKAYSREANIAEALNALLFEFDYRKVEEKLLAAHNQAPYSPQALNALAYTYLMTGRIDEARDVYLQLLPLVRTNDPVQSMQASYQFIVASHTATAFEEMLAEARIDNPFVPVRSLVVAYALAGMGDPEAIPIIKEYLLRWDTFTFRQKDMLMLAAYLAGLRDEAMIRYAELADIVEELPRHDFPSALANWVYWGRTHIAVAEGRYESAFQMLSAASSSHADYQLLIASLAYTRDPRYSGLREDPRFEQFKNSIQNNR